VLNHGRRACSRAVCDPPTDQGCKPASNFDQRPASNVDHAKRRQAHDSHREMSLELWSVFDARWAKSLVKLQRLFTANRTACAPARSLIVHLMWSTDAGAAPQPRCVREWPQGPRWTGPWGQPCPPPECPAADHSGADSGRGWAARVGQLGAHGVGRISGFLISRFPRMHHAHCRPRMSTEGWRRGDWEPGNLETCEPEDLPSGPSRARSRRTSHGKDRPEVAVRD